MKDFPLVTIVILNYNGKEYIENNLPYLIELTYPNIKIIVIDNASTDNTIEWLNYHYPSVSIVLNEKNAGFAQGYNIGLRNIKSDYYLLLNTDVEVTPNLLEPMIKLLEDDEKNAVCQPKILSYLDRSSFEYAGAAGGMLDKLGYPFARGRLFFTCEIDSNQYDDDIEIFWASGACFLVKAKCFWEANGFYEYYFMQHEETDLCWRLKLKGYKIFYSGKSHIYHVGGAHLSYEDPKKNFLNFRNNWIMNYRNMPNQYFWFYVFPIRTIFDILASFYFLFRFNLNVFLTIYKAHFEFYKWLLNIGIKQKTDTVQFLQLTAVHNRFIVLDYFLKRKKKFKDL